MGATCQTCSRTATLGTLDLREEISPGVAAGTKDTTTVSAPINALATLSQGLAGPANTGEFKTHLGAQATLGNDALRHSLRLPWGMTRDEWIAAKTVSVFKELIFLVSVLDEICTSRSCPRMTAGRDVIYDWIGPGERTPSPLTAYEYMCELVDATHTLLAEGDVFPRNGAPFPQHFLTEMKKLHRRFFRVYAHAYLHHFSQVRAHDCEHHVNYMFKHWLFFTRMFDLVTDDDIAPLRELVRKFEARADEAEAVMDEAPEGSGPLAIEEAH